MAGSRCAVGAAEVSEACSGYEWGRERVDIYFDSTQLLTAWCDNKRRRGGVLQNNKKNLAKNIRLIIPSAAKDGLLTTWVYFALDEAYWKYLISQLGSKKTECTGTEPNPRSTPPPVRPDNGLMLHPVHPTSK